MNYIESWKIDKDSKIPYAAQLVKHISSSITMGEILRTQKLPPIRSLAADLGISVNTVRSAYKQLEDQEMVITRPHHGTIVLSAAPEKQELERELAVAVKDALHCGLEIEDARMVCERVLREAANRASRKRAIFVDAHAGMVERYARQIAEALHIEVEGVLLENLQEYIERNAEEMERMEAIITTYFYYGQVRAAVKIYKPIVCGMAVELSHPLANALKELDRGALVGIVCENRDSTISFGNLIGGIRGDLAVEVCPEGESERLDSLMERAAILCVSPTGKRERELMQSGIPVYELWDRINEQSMNMLREYLK